MRNYFTLGGEDSRDYGVYISGGGVFDSPNRAIDFISVPGRNGDIIGMETRLENGTLTYKDAFIYADFKNKLAAFRSMLLKTNAYRRLIDSYNPDEYRLAVYADGLSVRPTSKLDAGRFDIVFNVMPQRFLLSGDTPTTLNASGSITNPTEFPSKPLIRVYGNGVLGVGADSITIINNAGNYIDIDCQSGIAYRDAANMNGSITLSGFDFPALTSGANGISLGAGISQVIITPRWWRV